MLKKIPYLTSVALFCTALFLTSCDDNPSSVDENPPELPSVQTMEMDFSAFESSSPQKVKSQAATDNFNRAVVTASIMKLVVDVNLAIPRALLTAAANSDAKLVEGGKWEWSYSKNANGNTYGVRLVAERENEETVDWEFYVTNSEAGLKNRLFFRGSTVSAATQGTWSYYSLQSNEAEVHVSEITWAVNGDNDKELKLEVVSNRYERQGDYIEYSFDGTVKTAVYFNAGKEETTKIQWNAETKEGFIIAPDYNNGEKACWDASFQDVACTS
ncbi:MAG TPA: hypothetical protein VFG39_01745 [Balneolaceae bacterium]|nr:hypothetical protein [Balneolaceae bacterium]